jgi:hypothetical protein
MQNLSKTLLITALTAVAATAAAAPTGYSINSDSGNDAVADSLYRIDLGTGAETRIASVTTQGQFLDVEGLAFAPDGTLYAVDESFPMSLFSLNPDNAQVELGSQVTIQGLPNSSGNDFGLTFACDGNLYLSSVVDKKLYRMGLNGVTQEVGPLGDDVEIVALAAYGNPVELYGLGKGPTSPQLFKLDIDTGAATARPQELGDGPVDITDYGEGGLAFDDDGGLWAITDTRQVNPGQPGQTLKIDRNTGAALSALNTDEQGFESLAITVPRGCDDSPPEDSASFVVQKQYVDGNDETPITLNISCNDGFISQESFTVQPNPGAFGPMEVRFVVTDFADGQLDCDVWESEPGNYSATYQCISDGTCTGAEDKCVFENVAADQDNLCLVRNYPDPVEITVTPEWSYGEAAEGLGDEVRVELICTNAYGGDGEWTGSDMRWLWVFDNLSPPQTALFEPLANSSQCRTQVVEKTTAVESESTCANPVSVIPGDRLNCVVSNSVFFEGIPTLSHLGLLLFSSLMLLTGLWSVRRF